MTTETDTTAGDATAASDGTSDEIRDGDTTTGGATPAMLVAAGWLAVTVLAAVRAADGERYRYPLTLQLIS